MSDQYADVDEYYRKFYGQMPCGSESGLVARLAHSAIERPFSSAHRFDTVIEVGAGNGLHFPFVRHGFRRYEMTDLRDEALRLAEERIGPRSDVRYHVADAQEMPHGDGTADRVIATCLLLHLPKPEAALNEWRRVCRPGGVVTIYVPNEPGMLTRTGRSLTTRRAAERAGFEGFDLMMAREHHNHGWGLEQMIRHTFRKDSLRTAGWPLPKAPLSTRVFTVYHARVTW